MSFRFGWIGSLVRRARLVRAPIEPEQANDRQGAALGDSDPATDETEGQRLYVLPDIHGCLTLLEDALARIAADLAAHPHEPSTIICLGDYIDRGPDSCGVIERLSELQRSRPTVCLKGNHEAMLLGILRHPDRLEDWKPVGGYATLMSYGVLPPLRLTPALCTSLVAALVRAMPPAHRAFLDGLKTSHSCGRYFFAHAGVRPGLAFDDQEEADLLWIRTAFLHSKADHGKTVVHGHTPVKEPEVLANRINLDTGAYATNRLTCLALEGRDLRFV